MDNKRRIAYLDFVKLWAIMLVVWGHALIRIDPEFSAGGFAHSFIYSFHMPLFMLVSGFFAASSLRQGFWQMLEKKSKQLLLPAVTCTLLSIAYFLIVRGGCDYYTEVVGNSWFLKTLFACYLLLWGGKKILKRDWLLLPLAVVMFIVPHAYSLQLNYLFPFFLLGYFMGKERKSLERYMGKIAIVSLVVFFLLFLGNGKAFASRNIFIGYNTLLHEFSLICLKYAFALTGSLASIGLGYYLCKLSAEAVSISKLGRYTLGIYVLQTFFLIDVFPDIFKGDIENPWLLNFIAAPLVTIFMLWLCIAVIRQISKSRIMDLLFFGGVYRQK